MERIEFHKRKAENNIRSIKLIHKGNCVKTIEFSEYQLFRILSDIGKMLERGDSKETIEDYVLPYINLHSSEEELNLDDYITDNTEELGKYKNLYKEVNKNHSRQIKTIENLNKKIEELEKKLKVKPKIITKTNNRGNKNPKKEDLNIDDILKEGLGV